MTIDFIMNSAYISAPRGISLIELLITISIISILVAVGLPQFRSLYERWQVLQTAQSMQSTLILARSLAIQRGGKIGIRKVNDSQSCKNAGTNQEWGCGWFIYSDENDNGAWNTSEPKLHEIILKGDTNVMHTSGGINIKFDRFGMASGLNVKGFTFTPLDSGISSPATQTLCMSSGGRIRIINDSSCQK